MAEDGEIASDVQLKRCRGKTCPTPQDEKDLQKDTEAEQNEQEREEDPKETAGEDKAVQQEGEEDPKETAGEDKAVQQEGDKDPKETAGEDKAGKDSENEASGEAKAKAGETPVRVKKETKTEPPNDDDTLLGTQLTSPPKKMKGEPKSPPPASGDTSGSSGGSVHNKVKCAGASKAMKAAGPKVKSKASKAASKAVKAEGTLDLPKSAPPKKQRVESQERQDRKVAMSKFGRSLEEPTGKAKCFEEGNETKCPKSLMSIAKSSPHLWFPKYFAHGCQWKTVKMAMEEEMRTSSSSKSEQERDWWFDKEMVDRWGEAVAKGMQVGLEAKGYCRVHPDMDPSDPASKQWKCLTTDKEAKVQEEEHRSAVRVNAEVDLDEISAADQVKFVELFAEIQGTSANDDDDRDTTETNKPKALTAEEIAAKELEKEKKKEDREKCLKTTAGKLATYLKKAPKMIDDCQKQLTIVSSKKNEGLFPKTLTVEYKTLLQNDIDSLKESRTTLEDLKGTFQDIRILNSKARDAVAASQGNLQLAQNNIKAFKKVSAVYLQDDEV